MKVILSVVTCYLVCAGFASAQTDQIAITADGRKVVLKPDKTWEYQAAKPTPTPANEQLIEADNVADVIKAVQALETDLKKSEFETETEYAARVRLLFSQKQNKSGRALDQTVLVFDDTSSYDAERQLFTLSPRFLRVNIPETFYGTSIVRLSRVVLAERFAGSWLEDRSQVGFTFSMDPETARKVKPNLALAIYGVPVQVRGNDLSIVPLKYVALNKLTGERYAERIVVNKFGFSK
jgi:hypothetical protein